MATPTQLRSQVAALSTLAERDLYTLWRQVTTAAQARQALNDVLPALVETYGQAAATVAAEWYDEARAKADIPGHFTAIPAALRDPGIPGLVEWSLREAASLDGALKLATGGLAKRLTNAAGSTIAGSSIADPQATGWQRVARAGACYFCQMLAGRGAVYREDTADFGAHDWCHCAATAAWKNRPIPVKPHKPSARNVSDADRARVRDWIATHL